MNCEDYAKYISAETLMGPSSVRILEELLRKYPMTLPAESKLLDLGCGKGLTSLVLAKETGAAVTAADLWISAEENAQRFGEWGVGHQITPVHADASELPFDKAQFDAMVSIDAYHYFGTAPGFFEEKILPFLKDGARVLIGVPGLKDAYAGRSEELLSDWLGDEAYMFRSPPEWKQLIGTHERIECVDAWEMDCFDAAWKDWFASGHQYAAGDRVHFDSIIRPCTCFAALFIGLK